MSSKSRASPKRGRPSRQPSSVIHWDRQIPRFDAATSEWLMPLWVQLSTRPQCELLKAQTPTITKRHEREMPRVVWFRLIELSAATRPGAYALRPLFNALVPLTSLKSISRFPTQFLRLVFKDVESGIFSLTRCCEMTCDQ